MSRLLLFLLAALGAASEPAMSAEPACARAEARQFDFWLGDWDVVAAPGAPNAGAPQRQRIAWIPQADGSVSQCWDTAEDGGPWQAAFVGCYRRVAPA